MRSDPGSVPCLNGGRDALRPDNRRRPRDPADEWPDLFRSTASRSAALLFGARKTGWPPPVPAPTGPVAGGQA